MFSPPSVNLSCTVFNFTSIVANFSTEAIGSAVKRYGVAHGVWEPKVWICPRMSRRYTQKTYKSAKYWHSFGRTFCVRSVWGKRRQIRSWIHSPLSWGERLSQIRMPIPSAAAFPDSPNSARSKTCACERFWKVDSSWYYHRSKWQPHEHLGISCDRDSQVPRTTLHVKIQYLSCDQRAHQITIKKFGKRNPLSPPKYTLVTTKQKNIAQ